MSLDSNPEDVQHKRWVKISHWIVTFSFLVLGVTGYVILMSHPRLYWGETGNELTPALLELPISRNHQHGGFEKSVPFFDNAGSPVTASRTYDIFNQNGWGRSLHFLSAWFMIITGLVYLLIGIFSGHFRRHLIPALKEFGQGKFWTDLVNHLRFQIPEAIGGPHYGLLQKCTYGVVVFVLLPLMVITGLAMSPAINGAFPFLSKMFGGVQSARTIHFFASFALVLFLIVHIIMIIKSGFKRQIRSMTSGK